ncbi:AAA family ATPase [Streptomyces virginiae]|uniref:AAA family ATPase n=1 Tax=Streptomyces virginiae TaxID=1961 RepID=UPI000A5EE808|nr:AAA family ATPase [Streptomyces virginiae]MCX4718182.1 ATP-binding protein [Streptomyces virginiae]
MITWINGAFGSGKSTLAAGLHQALPGSVVADPEEIGDLLRRTLAGHPGRLRDYQDYPAWRRLTTAYISEIAAHTSGHVIVPMTVLRPSYAAEVFTPLRRSPGLVHLVVHLEPDELKARIDASEEFPGDETRSEAVRTGGEGRWTTPLPPLRGCTPTATSSTPLPCRCTRSSRPPSAVSRPLTP